MAFDWISFFDANRIEYVTRGANVSRDNVAIHCPFCGADDHSQHLSVNLSGNGWRCFRRPDHKGKSSARLVAGLLNCSLEVAKRMVGEAIFIPDDFAARVSASLAPVVQAEERTLELPEEFKPINPKLPSARLIMRYLEGSTRGFARDEILRFHKRYGLRYAMRGMFKGRVIFPVRSQGSLVSWTGRSVYPYEQLRYRTLSTDPESKDALAGYGPALGPISDYLLWFDDLLKTDADTIVLVEGPFDALNVRVRGWGEGIDSTCFFTASPSTQQVNLLHELLPRYRRRLLLLDRGTLATALQINAMLSGLGVEIAQLPRGVKDPGLLTRRQLLTIT